MKRRICSLAVGALLMFAMSAMGQQSEQAPPGGHRAPGGGRGGRMMKSPDQQLAHLSEQIGLTDDQKPGIKAILQSQAEKMKALRDDSSASMEDKGPRMMEIRKATDQQIRAALTPDQQKKFDESRAKMREHRGPPPDGQRPPQ